MMERLLTVEQVAERLEVKVSTIYQWTYERYIPHVKLGRLVRFEAKAIEEWVRKSAQKGRTTRAIDLKELGL